MCASSKSADRITRRTIHIVDLNPSNRARLGARAGGVERYGEWLAGALCGCGRLSADGLRFALKARHGGDAVRCGDGVSAEWVRACRRSRWRWARHVEQERRAVHAARRVIAISPMVARELAAHYGREDARVVLNPVFSGDLSATHAPESAARRHVVFVGHGFHRKGLDHWLRACRHLSDVKTHVIGADAHLNRWRANATKLGVGDRVRFHGPVEAAPWIRDAAVLVHPARYEPYGNVIAEAVAMGTPSVASDACGAACLLDPTHIWPRTDGDQALVRCVELALKDPRPPRRRPPTAEAHLAQLDAALFHRTDEWLDLSVSAR